MNLQFARPDRARDGASAEKGKPFVIDETCLRVFATPEDRIVGEERPSQEEPADDAEQLADEERESVWGELGRQLKCDGRRVLALFTGAGWRVGKRRFPKEAKAGQEPGPAGDGGDPPVEEDALLVETDRDEADKQHELVRLQEQFDRRKGARTDRIARQNAVRAEREAARESVETRPEDEPAQEPNAATERAEAEAGEAVATPAAQGAPSVVGGLPYPLKGDYFVPEASMLTDIDQASYVEAGDLERQCDILQRTLDSFGIDARVGDTVVGPRVTLFRVDPAVGVKVESIAQISNNIAMELEAISIRILAPVPGKPYVGIQVPNQHGGTVGLRRLLKDGEKTSQGQALPVAVGRNIRNEAIFLDLAKAPHLLIAGATGSGKSVCLNSLLVSLLVRFSPAELRLLLIDPKVVEFACYERLPHLLAPVINEVDEVVAALYWLTEEMQRRYQMLSRTKARNLESFNARSPADDKPPAEGEPALPERLPFIVLVIDELADIMMTARGDVETAIARLAQKSRAVGIHLVVATQRPSVNVITGVIKSNLPTRIAFQVSSQIDARTILDRKGAESLLGRGDMLFAPPGAARTERIQSPLVLDEDIEAVVSCISAQAEPVFDHTILQPKSASKGAGELSDEDSELLQQAMEIVVQERRASTSYIQRRLRIGYNRAAELIEQLEERGVVGPALGVKPREILVDER